MSNALEEFKYSELQRCGYIVTVGFRACDHCGGGGLYEGENCLECGSLGEHKLTDLEIQEIEEQYDHR